MYRIPKNQDTTMGHPAKQIAQSQVFKSRKGTALQTSSPPMADRIPIAHRKALHLPDSERAMALIHFHKCAMKMHLLFEADCNGTG